MNDPYKKQSKFLSLVLRHQPELIGLELDDAGWTSVEAVLSGTNAHGIPITQGMLEEIVAKSPKQRFALSEDKSQIRANQGHSVPVELGLDPQTPPDLLFHGTVEWFLESIFRDGLQKRNRHHVHLSPDVETATVVGDRRGDAVLLAIRAGDMAQAGHKFFCSRNGVWLTDFVPPEFMDRHPG